MHIKKLRHTFFVASLLVLTSSYSTAQSAAQIDRNIKKAEKWLPTRAKELLQQTGVPGMAIAVVHDGKIIYTEGFGVRNVETKKPVNANTVFQLASVSKSVASTVIAGAVGGAVKGVHVKWDDRVQRYYPDFTLKDPDNAARVTIADMFSHRSGLPGEAGDDLEELGCNRRQVINKLQLFKLNPLGSTYNYSNFGMTVGAEAVAKATHKSWEDLSDEVLYEPLGMNHTSSRWSDYNKQPNKSDIHIEVTPGKWIVSHRQPDAQSPSGGVSSNVKDMAKWMILQLRNGRDMHGHRVIDKAALLATRAPLMHMFTNANGTYYYGLGMVNQKDELGRQHFRHSGAFSAGAATAFDLLPSEKLGIVVLTNGFPKGIPETIAQEFYDIVQSGEYKIDRFPEVSKTFKSMEPQSQLGDNIPPAKPAPAPKPNQMEGTYANAYWGAATIEKQGDGLTLMLNPCGKSRTYKLTHWDGNVFSFGVDPSLPNILATLELIPATDNSPSKIYLKAFDGYGFGTFVRSY